MDRYLFRGKRIDERIENGEWIEGDLIRLQPNRYGISINPNRASTMPLWEYIRQFTREIDPATIGQCTGLKDKNGRLIFEGDILKMYSRRRPQCEDYYREQSKADGECEILGTVIFKNYEWCIDYNNAFNKQLELLKGKEKEERTVAHARSLSYFDTIASHPNNFKNPHFIRQHMLEIIGNIHEAQ